MHRVMLLVCELDNLVTARENCQHWGRGERSFGHGADIKEVVALNKVRRGREE
jgi:hypothetical protein